VVFVCGRVEMLRERERREEAEDCQVELEEE
jgi:hypothetical protein